MNELIMMTLLVLSAMLVGGVIGHDIAHRKFSKELRNMLYDFDKDKADFDEWIAQRMAQIKTEKERF